MNPYPSLPRRRAAVMAVAVAVASTAGAVTVPAGAAHAQADCVVVEYQPTTWPTGEAEGGYSLTIVITNLCDAPILGWTLDLTLAPDQTVTQGWNTAWTVVGEQQLTAEHLEWNRVLGPGESAILGFIGAWVGVYSDPTSCTINGSPCGGQPGPNQPPEVSLTSPTEGEVLVSPSVLLAAEAGDPDGAVDRVEFYVEEQLVGTAETAPYQVQATVPFPCSCTAFARAFDDGGPPLSTDSEPVMFSVLEIPPLQIIMDPTELEIEAGSSEVVNVSIGVATTAEIEMSVAGDPGLTVSPESFTLDSDTWDTGQDVTVSADAGAAGAEAAVGATEINGFASIPVTVVGDRARQ